MLRSLAALSILLVLPSQQPTFKSGVDLLVVDVHVVDRTGRPILDLKPADFEVQVSGDRRTVVSAELITYGASSTREDGVAAAKVPSPDAATRPRRMYVLAVDEHSLHAASAQAAIVAAEKFIDRLRPDDLVGLYAYPTGIARHDLADDHASVRRELRKITGLLEERPGRFNLAPSEVIDVANGDQQAVAAVLKRECGTPRVGCSAREIVPEAIALAGFLEMQVSQSLGGLRGLVRGLREVPGRKILVLVSGGLISTDQAGGRANARAEISALGHEAALANLSVFALHLDWSFIAAQAARTGLRTSIFRDGNLAAAGLERVAGAAGGTVMRVYGTSPDIAFDRVLRETSAHYLLGVESAAEDRDGNPKTVRVSVKRRGVQVRSRTQVVAPAR